MYNSGIFDNVETGCCVGGAGGRIRTNTHSIGCIVGLITCIIGFVVSGGVGGVNVGSGVFSSGIFDNVGNGCCVGGAYGRI